MSRLGSHNERMKQTDLGLDLSNRRTRVFLHEMQRVVPWREFVALVVPPAKVESGVRAGS